MANDIPAISVIIPMYNAEKYVGECLDSILAQTFQDYEVIVVDDCSKDNSAKIVESYIPKFNGRLQLVRSKVNSGGAGVPRNTGLKMARGKYIFFMDSDDAIIFNALETLFNTAEKFNVDVIHLDNCYKTTGDKIDKQNIEKYIRRATPVVGPTELSDNLAELIKVFASNNFMWEPWNHLIRREFLIKENIEFSHLSVADDMLFSFFLLCLAKKIIVIPDLIYIWRLRDDSNSKENLIYNPEKCIHRKAGDVFLAIELIEEFANKNDFFNKNPQFKYAIFDFFVKYAGSHLLLELYAKVPAFQLDGLVRRELEQIKDNTALTAFLFARMNIFNVNLIQQQNLIRQQQAQIQQLQAQLQQLQSNNTQGFSNFHVNTEDIFNM